jgi:hypothetical protein
MNRLQQFRDFVEQVRATTDIAEVVGKAQIPRRFYPLHFRDKVIVDCF